MEKRKQTLYMLVTRDKYELPIAVATTQNELAKMLRVHPRTITYGLATKTTGIMKIEVELEEGEIL